MGKNEFKINDKELFDLLKKDSKENDENIDKIISKIKEEEKVE